MQTLMAKDVIALTVIIGLILFKLTGHNGSFDLPVALIIGYYFGHRKSKVDTGE